jgi:flagellar hook protein FlgE
MGLTSAMHTSVNGLALNETAIGVLGNNIANANTTGFKASGVQFATQFARTLSSGSRPTTDNGGTNPRQIGLGAQVATIFKDFSQGTITNSTNPSDMAIEGDGFFILDGNGANVYTRNGSFSLNSADTLVNAAGLRVQGYTVDDDFELVTTQLTDIRIPLGDLHVAQQTENIAIGGALNPNGVIATQGSLITSDALQDATAGPGPATAASLLVNVTDATATNLFTAGQTVTFGGRKGGREQAEQSLTVTAATTMQDLLNLMDATLGIHSAGTIPNDPNGGGQPGITMTAAGAIQIVGNRGTVNDLAVIGDDLLVSNGGTNVAAGIGFNKTQTADGESGITNLAVFDSLGQPLTVKLTTYLESVTGNSTTFRYFFESNDDSDLDVVLGDGTLVYDGEGTLDGNGLRSFSIDRNATAALSPMQIQADFSGLSGMSADPTTLRLVGQDGAPPGTLTSYVIDEAGIVNGVFDNGQIRTLGQVALARFANNQGLLENGGTTFREGAASGPPTVVAPGTLGTGSIRSGAIELSNTDIGRNLVDLIVASTNYRGNARVISSVQSLVDELLLLGR